MIIMYDLDDNILEVFNDTKDCAKYFNASVFAIHCHICRSRQGKIKRKRDMAHKRWVKLYREENDD